MDCPLATLSLMSEELIFMGGMSSHTTLSVTPGTDNSMTLSRAVSYQAW